MLLNYRISSTIIVSENAYSQPLNKKKTFSQITTYPWFIERTWCVDLIDPLILHYWEFIGRLYRLSFTLVLLQIQDKKLFSHWVSKINDKQKVCIFLVWWVLWIDLIWWFLVTVVSISLNHCNNLSSIHLKSNSAIKHLTHSKIFHNL